MAILDEKWQGENACSGEAGKIEWAVGVGEGAEGGGKKKETLHNKNALNYRMKPSSNCVIRLFLSPSPLGF